MPFIELQSVDSTNNYALAQVHADLAQHGQAYFAHEQVAGRGQRGRTWITEKDTNIILSLVIDPSPLPVTRQFWLSCAVAVATRDFFARYVGNDTKIKWPNDLYWQDRKAGGLLIESVIGSQPSASTEQPAKWKWAVAGIGININQTFFPPSLANPVSLKQISGKNFHTTDLAKELCLAIDNRFQQLLNNGFTTIHREYNSQLYKRDELVKFKKDTRVFEALVKEVNAEGKLVVSHSIEEEFGWGEIEWGG